MTRDEAHGSLQNVADAMSAQHSAQPDRLHQLLSHVATVRMVVDHLFDHAENAAAASKEG